MLKSFFSASSDLFNQATEHYRRLRYLEMGSPEYSKSLFETIRLCQLAIQKYQKDGDAHVLLANAYDMAALDCIFSKGFPFFLARAVAVMQTAKDERMYIKQRGIADKVFSGTLEQLSSQEQYLGDDVLPLPNDKQLLRKDYYQKAIDPSNLVDMINLHDKCNISS